MKPETLEALKRSIAHWELMANGGEGTPCSEECALCLRYDEDCITGDGEVCPVRAAGHTACNGTPFYEARDLFWNSSKAAFAIAAWKEVEFLKSLLPKE